MKNQKKLGLALGSGAVRGLAHIGIIKTLIKNGVQIDYITGASIGACIGAHFALYQDIEKLQYDAIQNKKEKLFTLLDPAGNGGFIKGDKLAKLFDSWWHDADFKNLEIPFKAVATDLITGQPIVFDKGSLSLAARASSAVPGIFAPVKHENHLLIDGAMSCPVPVKLAKEMGAEVVLAVNLYHNGEMNNKKWSVDKVAFRSAEIILNSLAEYSMQGADFIIRPKMEKYARPELYFIGNHDITGIEAGEKAAEKIIKKLKKALEN